MRTVYNVPIVLQVKLGLSSELTTKILGRVWSIEETEFASEWFRITSKRLKYSRHLNSNLQVAGLSNDLAISTIFTITVLIPFPLPSTYKMKLIHLLSPDKQHYKSLNRDEPLNFLIFSIQHDVTMKNKQKYAISPPMGQTITNK